jgi:hypothetical protein
MSERVKRQVAADLIGIALLAALLFAVIAIGRFMGVAP